MLLALSGVPAIRCTASFRVFLAMTCLGGKVILPSCRCVFVCCTALVLVSGCRAVQPLFGTVCKLKVNLRPHPLSSAFYVGWQSDDQTLMYRYGGTLFRMHWSEVTSPSQTPTARLLLFLLCGQLYRLLWCVFYVVNWKPNHKCAASAVLLAAPLRVSTVSTSRRLSILAVSTTASAHLFLKTVGFLSYTCISVELSQIVPCSF